MRRTFTTVGAFTMSAVLVAGGCASPRSHEMAVQDLKAQVGVLESRVTALDERQQQIEQKAWNQREDVSYLKGRTEASVAGRAADEPSDSESVNTGGRRGKNRGYLYHRPKVSISMKDIQRALKHAGYYQGHIDGVIGLRTKKAIRSFQKANGLRPDGIVGQQTWAKLQEHLATAQK